MSVELVVVSHRARVIMGDSCDGRVSAATGDSGECESIWVCLYLHTAAARERRAIDIEALRPAETGSANWGVFALIIIALACACIHIQPLGGLCVLCKIGFRCLDTFEGSGKCGGAQSGIATP